MPKLEIKMPETEAFLAGGSFLLFAGLAVLVALKIVPAANEKYVMLMLGALIGIVKDTFGRYFQATKTGQTTTAALTQLAGAGEPPPAEPGKS